MPADQTPAGAPSTPAFSVRRTPAGPGEIRVRISGAIDIATADLLADDLASAIAETGPPSAVVVDMAAVTFLSASGVGRLVQAARSAGDRDLVFRLVGCSGAVTRTLRHTGTDHLIDGR